jgi:transposase
MRAYSMDLRVRVLEACDAGDGTKVVAQRFRVSPAWVRRLKQRRREGGETAPRTPERKPSPRSAHVEAIRAAVDRNPGITLAELKAELKLALSLTTLWRITRDAGLTLKKKS